MTYDPRLDGYDWGEAFAFAGGPGNGSANLKAALGVAVSLAPFVRDEVAEICAMSEGENDGPSWIIYGCLRDGRWFYLSAGCDYTGWDCQAGGCAVVANTRAEIEALGLDSEARQRFGMTHTPKDPTP